MPTRADIQIVSVAYNSAHVIGDMLASVPGGVPVVIVDNASADAQALTNVADKHGAQVITNPTNRGFGAACNIGATVGTSPYLLFLNPDAQLDPGCLSALLQAAQAHPNASGFCANVRDSRGHPAFRRRSRLLPKSQHWKGPPPQADTTVPLMNGAAMFMQRAHFNAVGGFDETIFLYHEDDDLSVRLTAKFGPIRYVPNAIVGHAEGHSTKRSPETAAFKAFHMGQSAIYTMTKHKRPWARTRILAHALLQVMSPLSLVSARKRAKALGFLRGALTPLR